MIISVEGGIGVGKSTLIDGLWGKLTAVPHLEELNEEFLALLGAYNKDGSQAIRLQNYILDMRTRLISEIYNMDVSRIHLLERSTISDIVFANVMHEQGSLTTDDWLDFNSRADGILQELHPDLVVYLRCTPEVAFCRACARGRVEESDNDLEYFELLNAEHEKMIPEYCEKLNIPLLKISCSDEYPNADRIAWEILNAI